MTANSLHDRLAPSRRQFLAGAGTAVLAASAGCSAVLDELSDRLLQQVNVFNQTDRQLAGSIVVAGPDDATLLEDGFDLVAQENSGDGNQSAATYGDVWDGTGTYEVTVELDDAEIDGTSEASQSIRVEDPGNEKLAAFLGGEGFDGPISFSVGEGFSDFNATRPSEG